MTIKLDSEVQFLKGVGPRRAEQLARLGIKTVGDLLLHFPVRYEDRRDIRAVAELKEGETQTVRGVILSFTETRLRFGKRMVNAVIKDATGLLRAAWFNVRSDYLSKKFKPQMNIIATGRVQLARDGTSFEMHHPEIVVVEEGEDEATGGILPVYPLTEGVNQNTMRKIVSAALAGAPALPENLPLPLLAKLHLPARDAAVRLLHHPPKDTHPQKLATFRTVAHKRMIFEELFLIECAMAVLRSRDTDRARGIAIEVKKEHLDGIISKLPFELTPDQKNVLDEIVADISCPHPMNRLLQGEVGCGKTVVAAVAVTLAALNGYQAVLMAPTEILAEQHYKNITRMHGAFSLKTALLTSGTKKKDLIRERAANGEIDLLVGTHALIQQRVGLKNLGLAVIDEQHRFGVMQRAELIKKGASPNTLIMTATPIPRTLAMTLYGDLDISVIRTMPKGRAATETRVIKPSELSRAHVLIHREVEKGRQAYVIYPIVEESEKLELKAATLMFEEYRKNIFPDLRVGLVHGRMKQDEKADVMAKFAERELDILVSTTVIEVGIDQPNATVIMIEHAERFGLAQLHQLRGRVGRGTEQSHCLLAIQYPMSAVAKERLKIMTQSTDGFFIAEKDMELRGTGDLMGTRQSGLPTLRVANLVRDFDILVAARKEAFELIKEDPELARPECTALRKEMERNWQERFTLADIA
ncbi:MAG: ATP-dependent DNA helicase RecG [Nitrospinae bacterium]|nr:ATP-dependent DNA helicase RecG [Nitrospinota bacterium]